MRALGLNLFLACIVSLLVLSPPPAGAQPSTLAVGEVTKGTFEEVGYRYRRYRGRYGYRPYYRPYSYGYYLPYYRPYYRPYYGYGYGYRPYYRPGFSLWFGF